MLCKYESGQNNFCAQEILMENFFMSLIGAPDIKSNILGIRKETRCFNKESAVDNTRG